MARKEKVARDSEAKLTRTGNTKMPSSVNGDEVQARDMIQATEQRARQIVARAYKEASIIIAEAEQKAQNIAVDAEKEKIAIYSRLRQLSKSGKLTRDSYDDIDNLFAQIRYRLAKLERTEHTATDELRDSVNKLEYWVESLVADSLKLESLRRWLQGTIEIARKLRQKLDT